MKFFAHSKAGQSENEWQELEIHLQNVANLARQFASEFGFGEWGYLAGLWHDLGKYSIAFQNKLRAENGPDAHIETGHKKVDHSSAGAIHAEHAAKSEIHPFERVLSYIIAGHHAGLPDWISELAIRLNKNVGLSDTLKDIPSRIIDSPFPKEIPRGSKPPNPLALSLWIRMLFSCVVDSDFLDTEDFIDPTKASLRNNYPTLPELLPRFNEFIEHKSGSSPRTPINTLRDAVRLESIKKASHESAIFTLTVPTGGGKTLSSMAFALNHAALRKKRRIIYVIPYTSIIEQTADIFRDIFLDAVVEHQSNIDDTDPYRETPRSRLACENWDAPIIVTTAVQFFESLFANKTSRCRRLHNIANSIVILDEVQLLPPDFLNPILETIRELHNNYGVSAILSTATQPAFEPKKTPDFSFSGLSNTVEVAENPNSLHESLKRVRFNFPKDTETPLSWEELATELSLHPSVLCIVNSRKDCRTLHNLMPEGTIHLSALMCGAHRSRVIADIKRRLREGFPCRVISTQLVEAGVDIDFPVVYRALAGLDSIAQAAGRCNREGFLREGQLIVFIPPTPVPPGHLRQAAEIGRRLISKLEKGQLPLEAYERFFKELFWIKGPGLDRRQIIEDLKNDPQMRYSFRKAAEKFRIIDQRGYPCLVRYDKGAEMIDQLCAAGPDRLSLRKFQRYAVQISEWHWKNLMAAGDIVEPENLPGIYIQANTALYRDDIGLCFPREMEAYAPDDLII